MATPAERRFEIVEEPDPRDPTNPGVQTLLLGLKVLSQRALIAIDNLFCLLTVFSVFWLAGSVIPNPSPLQLVALALYAAFVLAANIIVRRK